MQNTIAVVLTIKLDKPRTRPNHEFVAICSKNIFLFISWFIPCLCIIYFYLWKALIIVIPIIDSEKKLKIGLLLIASILNSSRDAAMYILWIFQQSIKYSNIGIRTQTELVYTFKKVFAISKNTWTNIQLKVQCNSESSTFWSFVSLFMILPYGTLSKN